MKINNFRALKNLKIDLGSNLTMISGINAVGKSSILGLLAQICSFKSSYRPEKDDRQHFSETPIPDEYKTIYGKRFESDFKDHFKISATYDLPENKYSTNFVINDAEEQLIVHADLEGTRRNKDLRFVLRKQNTITNNSSRNITLPTIYLSLRRLTPFVARKTNLVSNLLNEEEKQLFGKFNRHVFHPVNEEHNFSSNKDQSVDSTVLTSSSYNIESASTGEDNLGQIISALISFIRLEKSWPDYKGGLFLIDELDASLFPKAQTGILELFRKVATKHKIQIVFTTHSPIMISKMLEYKKEADKNANTKNTIGINFLSNSTGTVLNHTSLNMDQIIAYLEVTKLTKQKKKKIHCYCEDAEAYAFLKGILKRNQRSQIDLMTSITLGGENLWNLVSKKIPEFSDLSIIVFDGDKPKHRKTNTINLPSNLPPDQLMFKILQDEPANSNYWIPQKWDKQIFVNSNEYNIIIDKTRFDEQQNRYILLDNNSGVKLRELFKNWFNTNKDVLTNQKTNPIKTIWCSQHEKDVENFSNDFDNAYNFAYSHLNYLA